MSARLPDIDISTDPTRLDRALIHSFLSRESYWAVGIAREVVDRSIDGSVPFGAYEAGDQVAFARAVTDGATFAWIADVFVVSSHRGRGIGHTLMEAVLAHPTVMSARNVLLGTADAHRLYTRFGFSSLPQPERYLIHRRLDREPFAPGPPPRSGD